MICGEEKIQISISVEIAIGQSTPDFRCVEATAKLRGDIAEPALSVIEEEMGRLCVAMIARDVANRIIDMSVDCRQIEMSIEIGIQESASETEPQARGLSHSGCDCNNLTAAVISVGLRRG